MFPTSTNTEPISVTIAADALSWARYAIRSSDGEFCSRGARPAAEDELAVIAMPDVAGHGSAEYDTAGTARAVAAQLLGYAYRLQHPGQPLPATLTTTPLPPTTCTATASTWELQSGLELRYRVPFRASLLAAELESVLTAELALRWARALLAIATELDYAYAQASRALHAERSGTTATANIRGWLTRIAGELTWDQEQFAERLRDVLADEEGIAHGETLFAALDIAHPDLPTSLADLRQLSGDTITHLDAAEVIEELALRYAIPLVLWTANTRFVDWELPAGTQLTEQQWRRIGRSAEMRNFREMVENEQANNGAAIDVRRALYQAGVVCRGCDTALTGEVAETLGRCDQCRPSDLATAVAAGCPGAEDVDDKQLHQPAGDGTCAECGLPLPSNYPQGR